MENMIRWEFRKRLTFDYVDKSISEKETHKILSYIEIEIA